MSNDDINRESISGDISQRAVSLYGQNEGVDDFPVLKAFQQYIDAEQEKARKRLLSVSIFFGIALIVVIAIFMVLLYGINARNQSLSDRLVEYAMSNANQRTNETTPQRQNDAALKAMTDTLVSLQKQIIETKVQPQQPAQNSERTKKDDEESEKIRKAKTLLDLEKQKLAVEKERMRQFEIDRQRRKLYPELYDDENSVRQDAQRGRIRKSTRQNETRTLTDEDIREILREAYSDGERESQPKTGKVAQPKDKEVKADDVDAKEEDVEDAIEYFKDDEYTIPVDTKSSGSRANFTIGL